MGIKGDRKIKERIAERMIDRFCLQGLENLLPGELSGGQQERASLARIMASEPEVILLGESFSALDEFLKDKLQQEMTGMLNDYKGTVILVSHSRDEIYRFSEELIVMDVGKTVCQGKTREIFANPEWKETAKLTGCKNIAAAEREDAHRLWIPGWGMTSPAQGEDICWFVQRDAGNPGTERSAGLSGNSGREASSVKIGVRMLFNANFW